MIFRPEKDVSVIKSFHIYLYPWHTKYEGYIVFVSTENMCVCVCVCKLFSHQISRVCVCKLFFPSDFSGTTSPRILKFGTNVGYGKLYCVKENQPPPAYHSLYLSFSFSPIKCFVTDFLAPMRARVFKFCIHLECGQVYCGENQDAEIYFCLLFPSLTPI